jgi:hypothetical protein
LGSSEPLIGSTILLYLSMSLVPVMDDMKVGDLVRHPGSVANTGMCSSGIIIVIRECMDEQGVMVLWEHGETCYSPLVELELISESR